MSSDVEDQRLGGEESPKPKEAVCRMFQLRICSRGKNCPDAHPGEEYSDSEEGDEDDQEDEESTPVCKFFLRNSCARGNSCPFRHSRDSDEDDNNQLCESGDSDDEEASKKVTDSPLFDEKSQQLKDNYWSGEIEWETSNKEEIWEQMQTHDYEEEKRKVPSSEEAIGNQNETEQLHEGESQHPGKREQHLKENVSEQPVVKDRVCRLYQLRICTRGKNCLDAHPGEESSSNDDDEEAEDDQDGDEESKKPAPVCKFFLRNSCVRGNSCPFRHSLADTDEEDDDELPDRGDGGDEKASKKLTDDYLSDGKTQPLKDDYQSVEIEWQIPNEDEIWQQMRTLDDEEEKRDVPYNKEPKGTQNSAKHHEGESQHHGKEVEQLKENVSDCSIVKERICRFYQLRICTRGKNCPDAHPGEESSNHDEDNDEEASKDNQSSKGNEVCRFFLQNTCKRGDSCPFKHDFTDSGSESEKDSSDDDSSKKKTEVCRFFLQNTCRRGDLCPFRHDLSDSESENEKKSSAARSSNYNGVCRYFLQNICNFGDACRFRHDLPISESGNEKILNEVPSALIPGGQMPFPQCSFMGLNNVIPPHYVDAGIPMDYSPIDYLERIPSSIYSHMEKERMDYLQRDADLRNILERRQGEYFPEFEERSSYERGFKTTVSNRYDPYYSGGERIGHRRELDYEDILERRYSRYQDMEDNRRELDYEEELKHRYSRYQYMEDDRKRLEHDWKYSREKLHPEGNTWRERCSESPRMQEDRYDRERYSETSVHLRKRSRSPHPSDVKLDSRSSRSSPSSDTDGRDICKYYIRGICSRRDKCTFSHQRSQRELPFKGKTKDWLKFCKYLPKDCSRSCKKLHISRDEEKLYKQTGAIGEEILGSAIKLALRINAPIDKDNIVCKDYLLDTCNIVKCPFLHYNKELFSMRIATLVRTQFQKLLEDNESNLGYTKSSTKENAILVHKNQAAIVRKLLETPSKLTLPVITPYSGIPVGAPVMPPVTNPSIECAEKLLEANNKIRKENDAYGENLQKLLQENRSIYKALDPEQPARDLDEIRSHLLHIFEEINWKTLSTSLTKNSVDYQHKKKQDDSSNGDSQGNKKAIYDYSKMFVPLSGTPLNVLPMPTAYCNVGSNLIRPSHPYAASLPRLPLTSIAMGLPNSSKIKPVPQFQDNYKAEPMELEDDKKDEGKKLPSSTNTGDQNAKNTKEVDWVFKRYMEKFSGSTASPAVEKNDLDVQETEGNTTSKPTSQNEGSCDEDECNPLDHDLNLDKCVEEEFKLDLDEDGAQTAVCEDEKDENEVIMDMLRMRDFRAPNDDDI